MNYEIFGPQSGSSLTREASSPFIIWLRKCVYVWLSIIVSFSLGPNCARKYTSVWQRFHTTHPQMRACHGKSCRLFFLPSHRNTHFVFLPTRLSVTSIFFLSWALLSQIVSSVENILSHNPLLGITWRCQPAKILHNRSTFFHRKSSRIMDLTLVKKAAMRTVWPRHRD